MRRNGRLPRATAESQGVDPSALLGFVDALDRLAHVHSVMVVRRGHVIAEGWWAPYARDRRHALFSLSKSFTSTAIGSLIHDGLLSLDDRVVELLPDDAPTVIDDRLAAMRVRHLLTMTTGHETDGLDGVTSAGGWARHLLALPLVHEPGSRFMYDTGATYLLSAIVTRLTGERLLDYLTPRLLAPLGIEGATWERDPDGIDVGGWGLSATTEDVAAFGQLYLHGGAWQGRQLVPAGWVTAATARQVSNGDPATPSDWSQGYGYQFWRGRHGAYRGDGAFGQLCVVMPEQQVVVAATAGLPDMQAEMDVLWDTLLPALDGGAPLSPDPAGRARLEDRLGTLCLPFPDGAPSSARAAAISGVPYRCTSDAGIDSLVVTVEGDRVEIRIEGSGLDTRVVCGHGRWLEDGFAPPDGLRVVSDRPASAAVGAYGWVSDDRLEASVWAVDTAIGWLLDATFEDGDRVVLELRQNVAFGTPPVIRATGVRADRP